MIIIAGTIKYDPANREIAAKAVAEIVAATRAEEGNSAYRFGIDATDDSVIHLFEVWRDQEALDAHMAAPHLAEFMTATANIGVTELDIQRYEAGEPVKFM